MSHELPISQSSPSAKPSLWPFFALGLVLIVLFWGINAWLISGSSADSEPEEIARGEARVKNLAEVRADDQEKLTKYAWADRATGSVQIPIDVAMQEVIPRLNAERPRPAYPVAVPVPPVGTEPAAAAPAPAEPAAPDPAATPATPAP